MQEFVANRPVLQEILKEVLQKEENAVSDIWMYVKKGNVLEKE